MATGLQVSVVDRLGARGALALLHERRSHLLRHERFLEELWARVRSVRGTYVLKSWRPEATYVAGKFPPFGAPVVSLTGTKNAKRLFALSGGRLTVWRRDSRWKPPHIRAREKQLHPSLDDAPEEEEAPQEEYEKAPETKEELEERDDYNGPELAHSAELDYQGADDLPELLPREAAQAPAPRGFARPGDLSAGGGEV